MTRDILVRVQEGGFFILYILYETGPSRNEPHLHLSSETHVSG